MSLLHDSVADRLRILAAPRAAPEEDLARDVAAGLAASPRRLSCRFFYDAEGSQLFEAICDLPEYYLTRAERRILERHADEMAAHTPGGAALVELGSGSAAKTRLLIEALLRRDGNVHYLPVDISESMLRLSSEALLRDYPRLRVTGVAAEYEAGLALLERETPGPKLLLWLGSNVGNFHRDEAAAFLARVRERTGREDRLLMGIDRRKSRSVLEAAYDDAQGVTACFNKNLLARINRELAGDFDLDSFRHRAVYREEEGRIEMYLVSRTAQRVRIEGLGLEVQFADGEAIHTENSYKYSAAEIEALAAAACFSIEARWDEADVFSDVLLRPSA